jgi:chorismate mutase/prephenate dehydratase
LIEKLKEIDRQLLKLVHERCAILSQLHASGEAAPSLRSIQSNLTLSNSESRYSDLDRPFLGFVSGITYLHSISKQTVAYLGPEYSYSYSAAAKYFGATEGLQPVNTIGAVFEAIHRNQATYGVVPIENSTDGRIVDTLTMFIRMPTQICGEILLPIHHNLISKCKREEIREVYSKPQALSQCRNWLNNHLPDARWIEVSSTAAAAKIAATQPNAAAVASREAAVFLGLDIIAESIEDNPNNVTRFAIIGNETAEQTGDDKTSILFQVPHKPGALADVMDLLRDNGLNLTWIESFPVPGAANEYFFFVEFDGHRMQSQVQAALSSLAKTAIRLDFLGSYAKGR